MARRSSRRMTVLHVLHLNSSLTAHGYRTMCERIEPVDAKTVDRKDQKPSIDAKSLLGNHREAELIFQGEVYRLRITRNHRLLLTK